MKQVVLVTGASSGIGKDMAMRLIDEGYAVYGAARRLAHMNDLVDKGARAIEMDILDDEAIDVVISTIIKEHGRLDILINNAGYATWGAVETVSLEDARRQFDVNLFGLASITKKSNTHHAPTEVRKNYKHILHGRAYLYPIWCMVSCYQTRFGRMVRLPSN